MSKVLIDTDVAIDFLRGDHQAKKLIEQLWMSNNACISLLSIYELYAGMRESELQYTENFISACQIQQLTHEIVKEAGHYYRFHRSHGLTLTSMDCMIYVTAKHNDYKLLTRNFKHYPDKEILLVNQG
jgi:predicted nucleic acid-binding protein